jgi:hypothetical protein
MITHNGSQIVLAPKFAHEIGLHPQLDSTPVFMREHHSHIAGFEVFREIGNQGIPHEVIRMKLTRNLGRRIFEHAAMEFLWLIKAQRNSPNRLLPSLRYSLRRYGPIREVSAMTGLSKGKTRPLTLFRLARSSRPRNSYSHYSSIIGFCICW